MGRVCIMARAYHHTTARDRLGNERPGSHYRAAFRIGLRATCDLQNSNTIWEEGFVVLYKLRCRSMYTVQKGT